MMKKIIKVIKSIGIFILYLIGIFLVSVFGIIYFCIKSVNFVFKKVLNKNKDLIPIEDWLDKYLA